MVQHTHFTYTYKYPWFQVANAVWNKWPDPEEERIISVDVVNQEVSEDKSVIKTKRMFKCLNIVPKIFHHVLKNKFVYFEEDSTIDFRKKELKFETINRSFDTFISISEIALYKQHPQNAYWTYYQQDGKVICKGIGVIGEQIEKFCAKLYHETSSDFHTRMDKRLFKLLGAPHEKVFLDFSEIEDTTNMCEHV